MPWVDLVAAFVEFVLDFMINLLPLSPFANFTSTFPSGALAGLNWLVDIGGCIDLYMQWLACLVAYWVFRVVMNALKSVNFFHFVVNGFFSKAGVTP